MLIIFQSHLPVSPAVGTVHSGGARRREPALARGLTALGKRPLRCCVAEPRGSMTRGSRWPISRGVPLACGEGQAAARTSSYEARKSLGHSSRVTTLFQTLSHWTQIRITRTPRCLLNLLEGGSRARAKARVPSRRQSRLQAAGRGFPRTAPNPGF